MLKFPQDQPIPDWEEKTSWVKMADVKKLTAKVLDNSASAMIV